MISIEELQNLYENELKVKLAGLESKRKKVMLFMVSGIALFALPFLVFFAMKEGNGLTNLMPLSIIVIVGAIVLLVIGNNKKKVYRNEFKKEVVTKVVNAIDPLWNYNPNDRITQSEYYASDMFRRSCDRYVGDDLISGMIEKTDFRCSELHTEYKTYSTDSDGDRKEEWHTIFRGLFFHADFNKEFHGRTYISPDYTEKRFGKFLQSKKAKGGSAELVKLENMEFEKLFKVYSTDQNEARYILTPAIMETLVNLRQQINRPMDLSFVGSRVYCAISFNKNLFEPRIMKSGVNFEDIAQMYRLFKLNAVIIHELNLNTRIWTKD